MPVIIDEPTTDQISFEEFSERLRKKDIDPNSHESLASASMDLKQLANNPTFLSEIIASELKNYKNFQDANPYSSQSLMLDPPGAGKKYFVRANIWPAKENYMTFIHGEDSFFYHKPHDHNFNFLTVGYFGSGYWSDYYEYDYEDVIGYPGEHVPLRFVERSALCKGKVMMYRAHLDIHDQLPADDFSISLNIMENSIGNPLMDQYSFDVENQKIKSIVNNNSTKALLDVVAIGGGSNQIDLVDHIARTHAIDRVRLNAIDSIAKSQRSETDVISHYEKFMSDSSPFIRQNLRLRLEKIYGEMQ